MKRLFALVCASVILSAILCGCMTETEQKVKDTASEASSGLQKVATEVGFDSQETRADNTAATEPDLVDKIEENVDDMVENGEVEDGDGNVGDLENTDGDGNTAE